VDQHQEQTNFLFGLLLSAAVKLSKATVMEFDMFSQFQLIIKVFCDHGIFYIKKEFLSVNHSIDHRRSGGDCWPGRTLPARKFHLIQP